MNAADCAAQQPISGPPAADSSAELPSCLPWLHAALGIWHINSKLQSMTMQQPARCTMSTVDCDSDLLAVLQTFACAAYTCTQTNRRINRSGCIAKAAPQPKGLATAPSESELNNPHTNQENPSSQAVANNVNRCVHMCCPQKLTKSAINPASVRRYTQQMDVELW